MDSFDALYLRYREPVLGYFARRVGEPEVAADLMAETFARALQRYESAPLEEPLAWLFTIARNLLIDSARRGQVEASARRKLVRSLRHVALSLGARRRRWLLCFRAANDFDGYGG